MSKQNIALAFFKEKGIDCRLELPVIIFHCFRCFEEAAMKVKTTEWECKNCESKGTLKHLINALENGESQEVKDKKLYNPKRALRLIDSKFQSLEQNSTNIKELKRINSLKLETFELISFLMRTMKKESS